MNRSPLDLLPPHYAALLRQEFGGESVYIPRREHPDPIKLRTQRESGMRVTDIAKQSGICRSTVYYNLKR